MNADQTARWYEQKHGESATYAGLIYSFADLQENSFLKGWLSNRPGRQVDALDVGCGKAAFLLDFRRMVLAPAGVDYGRVVGMDLVESPGNRFKDVSDRFEFMAGNIDGGTLALADASMDIVSCNHVLEHVFYTEKLLREFHRILRPGSVCIVSVPNLAAWLNRVLLLLGVQPYGTEIGAESISYGLPSGTLKRRAAQYTPSGHIREFTPRGLSDLCEHCGFTFHGWWNQELTPWFRLTRCAGRSIGVILHRP